MGITAPPGVHISKFFQGWAAKVNKVNPGALTIKVIAGTTLGNVRTIYGNVRNDVANIGWVSTGTVTGKFKKVNVTRLPGLYTNAERASVAMWKLYKKGLFDAEFDEVTPLAIHTFPKFSIHTTFPVKKFEDLKGKKLAIFSRVAGDVVKSYGATPISVPLPRTYQAVQKGLVDGVLTVWTAFFPFKLQEVVKNHFEVNSGGATSTVVANPKSLAGLGPEAKRILAAHSGEGFSRSLGKFWDGVWLGSKKAIGKMPGQVMVELSPAQAKLGAELTKSAIEAWKSRTAGGAQTIEAFLAQYNAVK